MARNTGSKGEQDNWEEAATMSPTDIAATHSFTPPEDLETSGVAMVTKAFGGLAPVAMELDLEAMGTDFATLAGDAVELAEVLGEFELVDKADLIGVPFLIVGVNLNDTDLTDDGVYANIRCVTYDQRLVCFNDGGTGVYKQVKRILNQQVEPKPIKVKGGLRASTFHVDKDGHITEGAPNAAVFYLSSSLASAEKSKLAIAALGK